MSEEWDEWDDADYYEVGFTDEDFEMEVLADDRLSDKDRVYVLGMSDDIGAAPQIASPRADAEGDAPVATRRPSLRAATDNRQKEGE